MARIEESVEIKRPVDKVFAYLMDAHNWPYWASSILEVEQTSVGQMGVGTTFRGVDRIMGRRMAWTSKIMEYEPNRKMGQNITSGNKLVEEHLTFDPVEDGTKFTFMYEWKAGGFPKLIAPIMLSIMRKQMKKNLSNLKGILEAQA